MPVSAIYFYPLRAFGSRAQKLNRASPRKCLCCRPDEDAENTYRRVGRWREHGTGANFSLHPLTRLRRGALAYEIEIRLERSTRERRHGGPYAARARKSEYIARNRRDSDSQSAASDFSPRVPRAARLVAHYLIGIEATSWIQFIQNIFNKTNQ